MAKRIHATDEDLQKLSLDNPGKFVEVAYNNGRSNKPAFAFGRKLFGYGFSYYSEKFTGTRNLLMHIDDAAVAPNGKVTLSRGIVADTLRKGAEFIEKVADKGAEFIEKVADKVEDIEDKLAGKVEEVILDKVEEVILDNVAEVVEDSTFNVIDDVTEKPKRKPRITKK